MESDLVSHIALVEKLGGVCVTEAAKAAMPQSLTILVRDYRLASLKVVAVIKTLNGREYIIAQADTAFFVSQDGISWSPLPVLSTEESLTLHAIGYGLLSPHPFIGDPSIQIHGTLLESHRLANLICYLSSVALFPCGALEQGKRFTGLSSAEAEAFEAYEVAPVPRHNKPKLDLDCEPFEAMRAEHQAESMLSASEMLHFQFAPAFASRGGDLRAPVRPEDWEMHSDPYRRLTVLSHKYWSGLRSYVYWRSRVFGWLFTSRHGANSALYGLPDLVFATRAPGFKPAAELEEEARILGLKQQYQSEEERILGERAARKQARLDARREAEERLKARLERREQRRLEREAAEEAARRAAEEAEEGEGEAEDEAE
ncbi:hypothetical protein GMRT_15830 [Giardia muris]|uniref:Radial spokehead-like protein n=1 Tax=Giardia muris TaxID=5742 RepID=A0A4Z1SLQ6_GIAMU|nr:hypothetical protein GMRT_15830 [Giardia muris]|eukprot:TNJ26596.1 hypothetical protein GMRT_15830 [Giardia muris]